MRNPASSRRGKCRSGCSNRVQRNEKTCAYLYAWRRRVPGGCGKDRDDESTARDDRYAARDNGFAVPNDGSAARDDRYGSLKKIGRRLVRNIGRRVQGRATGDGRRRLRSRDDRSRIGRRRVPNRATTSPTPRGHVASTIYKGGRLVRDSCFD